MARALRWKKQFNYFGDVDSVIKSHLYTENYRKKVNEENTLKDLCRNSYPLNQKNSDWQISAVYNAFPSKNDIKKRVSE